MNRIIALLLVALLCFTLFTACAEGAEGATDFSETGTLNLSWPSDNGTDLLPFPWSNRNYAVAMMFDSLVTLSSDGVTMVPELAKEWTISDDGLTYTFTIRDDVLWHDGTPLTPEDVEFSINGYIKNPTSEYPSSFTIIKGGDAVAAGEADACTGIEITGNDITFHLTTARNDFLTYCAIVSILPKHLLKDVDPTLIAQDEEFLLNPVGCGPYKLESANPPLYYTLVRNDDYYGEKAGIRHVVYTSYVDGGSDAVAAAAIAGNLDFIYNVKDFNEAENMVKNNPDLGITVIPANYARYFVFNTAGATDGKYNDDVLKTEVRQAINLLLDKQGIANFYNGQATPLTTFVNPDSPEYNSNIPPHERDVETAKQMLEDAGFDFSRPLRVGYHYKDQTTADIMSYIAQNLEDAGIKVELTFVSGSVVDVIYHQHNWDMYYFGNYGLDAVDSFYYNIRTPYGLFVEIQGDFELDKKAEFSQLYNDFYAAKTDEEKKAILDEFQVKHLESMYTIPVYVLNKLCITNFAKFSYPEGLFDKDILDWLDYQFSDWKLLAE